MVAQAEDLLLFVNLLMILFLLQVVALQTQAQMQIVLRLEKMDRQQNVVALEVLALFLVDLTVLVAQLLAVEVLVVEVLEAEVQTLQ